MTGLSWPSEACHCAPWVEIGRWCTLIGLLQPSRGYDRAAVWRNCASLAKKSARGCAVVQSRDFHVTPAFLTEGCPSGASGSLVRASVDQQQCETTAFMAVVLIVSGKRDSNSRPRPWQGRALPTELFPQYLIPVW